MEEEIKLKLVTYETPPKSDMLTVMMKEDNSVDFIPNFDPENKDHMKFYEEKCRGFIKFKVIPWGG